MIRRIDVGGHSLEVEESGSGDRTFLCLHGLADTLAVWRRVLPGLGRHGSVVAVNQRAHGGSDAPPPPYRRDDLASDVDRLLGGLGRERAILVGHSMGGIVSMAAALAHPRRVAGLVLIGTASQASERVAGWYGRIAEAAENEGLDGLRRAIFGPDSRREIAGDPRGLAAVTRCLASLHDDPLTPKLAAVACPTLLLVGEKDPMGPAASAIIGKAIPGATLEVVPAGGHWLHVDHPDLVVSAIEGFLERHFAR